MLHKPNEALARDLLRLVGCPENRMTDEAINAAMNAHTAFLSRINEIASNASTRQSKT